MVEQFVRACESKGIIPGLYYCSWDNHNRFGSLTPSDPEVGGKWPGAPFTTPAYHDFQSAQIRELLTRYGKIGEVWIDIPVVLPRHYRNRLYAEIAALQPEAMIMMNNGIDPRGELKVANTWPTDLLAVERFPPDTQHKPAWLGVPSPFVSVEGKDYDLPREYCDTVGTDWFYKEGDVPRSDAELLGLYLLSRSRGANVLFDIGPDKSGRIPKPFSEAILRLAKNRKALGLV
ncbi:MAG: alpha-L-fucosidase [Spirochaetia bacterium]|nr:alpha-L-fucosidase [Spirochaetia bacterium]